MKLSIVGCLFVLDNEPNSNKKRNDVKSLKVLVNKNTNKLLNVDFDKSSDIKELIRDKISETIGSKKFHLEQVYTFGEKKFYEDNSIDIIYMALTNIENIHNLDDDYELIDLNIKDNEFISFNKQIYNYKTKEKKNNSNIEYYHVIKVNDLILEKTLLEILTVFKYLRNRIDNTDVCFKLLPTLFTLEDVRIVYEMIKSVSVDKSNFRKKIAKYVEKQNIVVSNKGYRPTQMYKFKPLDNDFWL